MTAIPSMDWRRRNRLVRAVARKAERSRRYPRLNADGIVQRSQCLYYRLCDSCVSGVGRIRTPKNALLVDPQVANDLDGCRHYRGHGVECRGGFVCAVITPPKEIRGSGLAAR